MSDPLILKRCMAALQAKYILTDDEAKGMASAVLGVASALWYDPPRSEHDDRGALNEAKSTDLASENERLREYYEAREAVAKVGLLNATEDQLGRIISAREAIEALERT